jgi:hypothetical protein
MLVVAATGVFQAHIVVTGYAVPTLRRLWSMRDLSSWQRAALFEQGEEFAGFVAFLRSEIPEEARVILPPLLSPRAVAHTGLMQYYLFPRDIHNCGAEEVEACILRVTGRRTYILAVPEFPPRELAEKSKRFVSYRDGFGVFVPK